MFDMSVDFWSFVLLYHEKSNFQCNYKSKHNTNILMQSYYCLLSPICSHKWMWYYYKWTDLIILIVRNHIYVHTLQSFLCKSYLGVNDELVNESWIFFSFNVINFVQGNIVRQIFMNSTVKFFKRNVFTRFTYVFVQNIY